MKKTIKLTEADLRRIVKRVINETQNVDEKLECLSTGQTIPELLKRKGKQTGKFKVTDGTIYLKYDDDLENPNCYSYHIEF
jgi:hypothetical protein